MKFTDVLKACLRYWFIIVICMAIICPIAIAITYDQNSYTAKSTILVEKNENAGPTETLSQSYVESIIKETDMLIKHNHFANQVIDEISEKDPEFGNTLSVNSLRANLDVSFTKGDYFFEITYINKVKAKSEEVVDTISNKIITEFNSSHKGKAKLTKVYTTEIIKNTQNIALFSVIGLLIGFVLGIVIVTFLVVFNPYVENEELLESQTELEILAVLDKKEVNR